MYRPRLALLIAFSLGLLACGRPPKVDPAYAADLEKARTARLASLTKEEGWLSLVGLYWLQPGENAFGSDPAGPIVLAAPGIPARSGVFVLGPDGTVTLRAEAGAPVTVNGAPPAPPTTAATALAADVTRKPDRIAVGRLRLTLIRRADQLGIRVRDPESPTRTGFKGIRYFPVNPALRVAGTFEPYASPREVEIASTHGPAQKMLATGLVRFTVLGKALALEPFVDEPGDRTLFFVFRDTTAGKETYGAGRFLYADAPKPGSSAVVLDFNRAINPPCAFTPFATCPLPPAGNVLPARLAAGELAPGGH